MHRTRLAKEQMFRKYKLITFRWNLSFRLEVGIVVLCRWILKWNWTQIGSTETAMTHLIPLPLVYSDKFCFKLRVCILTKMIHVRSLYLYIIFYIFRSYVTHTHTYFSSKSTLQILIWTHVFPYNYRINGKYASRVFMKCLCPSFQLN